MLNVTQALELKSNYALAHILKGFLVLSDGDLETAPKLFLHANNIRKDIYSYKGKAVKHIIALSMYNDWAYGGFFVKHRAV